MMLLEFRYEVAYYSLTSNTIENSVNIIVSIFANFYLAAQFLREKFQDLNNFFCCISQYLEEYLWPHYDPQNVSKMQTCNQACKMLLWLQQMHDQFPHRHSSLYYVCWSGFNLSRHIYCCHGKRKSSWESTLMGGKDRY